MDEVYTRTLTLPPGGVVTVDVALETHALDVLVSDAAGEPVRGAELTLAGLDAENRAYPAGARTDGEGRARVRAYRGGRYRLDAFSSRAGAAEEVVELPASGAVRLALDPGAPLSGTFTVPGGWLAEGSWFPDIGFRFEREGRTFHRHVVVFPADDREFEIRGIPPGPVEVQFLHLKRASRPIRIELPEGGLEGVELRFEGKQREQR